jgi:hypothetical protein
VVGLAVQGVQVEPSEEYSMAVVVPVICPSLPPAVVGATPFRPVGAAGAAGVGATMVTVATEVASTVYLLLES